MRKSLVLAVAVTLLIAVVPLSGHAAGSPDLDLIPGAFIVTVADGVDPTAVAAEYQARDGARIERLYHDALNGFAGQFGTGAVNRLRNDDRVIRVEQDRVVRASQTIQSSATWGLDRTDQRQLPLDTQYTHVSTAAGVRAYVIDTGIRRTHTDFLGRVTGSDHYFDAFTDGRAGEDCNGHGTHVAGTIGGATWGVAKDVTLVPVRVLDCNGSGTVSGVVAGLDWVTANRVRPAVANMSLGGGASSTLDSAVQATIDAGVSVVVAAGNGNRGGKEQDACAYSPARVPAAITVGATTSSDAKTSWSNYGDCVDWFAAGSSITSAWYTGDTDSKTISGTSMAAPHVAGAAALYLADAAHASPATTRTHLYDATTKGIVTSSSTTNNHLLYTRWDLTDAPASNEPPSTSFTVQCTDLACTFTDTSTDTDGSIASWSWAFGDNTTSTTQHPQHEYASADTYTVTLTVTDDGGASNSSAQNVTITAPSTGGITVQALGYKVKGLQKVDLSWAGSTATSFNVYRDGTSIATTASTAFTDHIDQRGGSSYTYQVCETATSTCSNTATVTF